MSDSIFTKIKNKEIPGNVIYEDDKCFALEDINPDKELLGHLLLVSKTIAEKYELENNYRLVINNGAGAGQSVFHIHVHLMGGRSLDWPPG